MNKNVYTVRLSPQFSQQTIDRLRYRAIRHGTSMEGYIKRLLNRYISSNTLPPAEAWNRHWPITAKHPPEHPTLSTTYAPMYLDYLDNLRYLPGHYLGRSKSRRRILETLTLIDLFDTGA